MIIKKIGIWNNIDGGSFLEDKLNGGINIICGTDNKIGKSIVMNTIALCLGNKEVSFQSPFEKKEHTFFLEIEIDSENLQIICLKGESWSVLYNSKLYRFENLKEYSEFWDKNIFDLPHIDNARQKGSDEEIIYLEALHEIFIQRQNKVETHIFQSSGNYKKKIYEDLVYQLLDEKNIGKIEKWDNTKEEKLKSKLEMMKDIKKEIDRDAEFNSYLNENAVKLNLMELEMTDFIKKEREINKKIRKNQNEILKLRSLDFVHEKIEQDIICSNCKSNEFLYVYQNFEYDVFNDQQLNLLKKIVEDDLEKLSKEITDLSEKRKKLRLEMESKFFEPNELENYYKYKIVTDEKKYNKYKNIESELEEMKKMKEKGKENPRFQKVEEEKVKVGKEILNIMNQIKIERKFDIGVGKYEKLYTTKSTKLTGSSAQIFLIVRMIATNKILSDKKFPIIIDGFRDLNPSSENEQKLLNCFREMENQIILTMVLKENEAMDGDQINYIKYTNKRLLTDNNKTFVENIKKEFQLI